MNQPNQDTQSQRQENLVKDTNVGGDLIFAPIQAEKYIETEIIQISVAKVTQRELIKTSPYQGLNRFNFKDRDRFFGRDKLIARLFDALNRSSLSLVLGASGSGKSSAVRAGLIPELKKSLESSKFYDFIFTPNEDPFESLYRCLLNEEKDYSFSKSEAEIALKAEIDTLAEVIGQLKKDDERWLIFVDQFEELFTSCQDLNKRKNFIESLVCVANSGDNSVKIMLAMRADFLEQLSSYPALGAIANENNIHLVTDMHPDELRQAIEQPAAKHGVVFEEGLVEQIIEEVEGQKGYLPLLQYTLNLLWETEYRTIAADDRRHIEDRTLNKTSYAALEGVRGALQKRVNEIYNNLNQDEQSSTKQIFARLVNIVDTESGSKTVSRRANQSEFVGKSIKNTLQTFIDENLLVSSSEILSAEKLKVSDSENSKQSATVEIAHEILLSSWDKLKSWIDQEKEAIILKNWLAGETKRWQKILLEDKFKAREELLKGSRLEQVVEFRKKDAFKNIGGLRDEENEFIDASVEDKKNIEREKEEQRQRELEAAKKLAKESEAKRKIAEKARQAAQRTRNTVIAAGLVMAGLAVFAGLQWRNAQIAQIRALINSSDARFAAGQEFDALLDSLRATKKLQALFLGNHDSQLKADNAQVLQQAVYGVKEYNRLEGNDEPLGWGVDGQISWSPDGQTLAFASGDKSVKLWRQDGTKPKILKGYKTEVLGVSWSPDGQILATISDDGTVKLWKLNGDLLKMFKVDERPYGINWSPDGELVAIPFFNATVQLWKPDGTLFKTLEGHSQAVFSVSWNPDGQILASGSADRTVRLWKRDGNLSQTSEDYRSWVTGVSWSPNGQILAFGTRDGTIRLRKSDETVINLKHERDIVSVSWSPDGKTLATSSFDKTVKWWKQDGTLLTTFHFPTVIAGLKWSLDGKILATLSGGHGTVRLWKKNPLLITLNNQDNVNDASFSPDGKILATASEDGTVKLWTKDGNLSKTLLKDYDGSVKGVSWSPDGQILASAHFNTVKLWMRNGTLIKTLTGHENQVSRVSWSTDGKILASCDGYHNLNLWQRDGTLLNKVVQYSCADLSWSPDGNGNILAAVNGNIRSAENGHVLLRKQDGTLITKLDIENVSAVSWSSDGQTLTTIGDNKIKLWNRDGRLLKPIETDGSALGKIAWSPDRQTLATSSENTIKLWKLDGTLLTTLKGHTDVVNSVTWSPDGKSLATASSDKTVKLWRLDVNLDEEQFLKGLLIYGCDWMREYLENNPNVEESDRHLCDGIGVQK